MKRTFSQDGQQAKRIRSEGETGGRAIYFGGVGENCTISDILDNISGGVIDNVRILLHKNCAFVTFLLSEAAHAFYQQAAVTPIIISGRKVSIGWGNSKPLSLELEQSVSSGASRNVFVGGSVDERTTEIWFNHAFGRFGPIDCIDVLPNKRIAFVHFGSIESAIKCVTTLSQDPQWQPFRLSYGKDRCIEGRKSRSNQKIPYTGQGLNAFGMGMNAGFRPEHSTGFGSGRMQPSGGGLVPGMPTARFGQLAPGMGQMNFGGAMYGGGSPNSNFGNRTIYLGGFTEELTLRDLCDTVRGGLVDNIKALPEKKCAFVTFIYPHSANMFYQRTQIENGEFSVKGKRLKVGWGKSRSLAPEILEAISRGATRNVFLGNIDDQITEERLTEDLAQFGTIEKINVIAAKKIAFINFTSITAAITCVNSLRSPESALHRAGYENYRANYGKDRCASDIKLNTYTPSMMPTSRPLYANNFQAGYPGAQLGYPGVQSGHPGVQSGHPGGRSGLANYPKLDNYAKKQQYTKSPNYIRTESDHAQRKGYMMMPFQREQGPL